MRSKLKFGVGLSACCYSFLSDILLWLCCGEEPIAAGMLASGVVTSSCAREGRSWGSRVKSRSGRNKQVSQHVTFHTDPLQSPWASTGLRILTLEWIGMRLPPSHLLYRVVKPFDPSRDFSKLTRNFWNSLRTLLGVIRVVRYLKSDWCWSVLSTSRGGFT